MELLKKLREQKGYTLSALSRETNLSASFLKDIETGHRKPSEDSLLRIAKVLGSKCELFFVSKKLEPDMEKILFEKDLYIFFKRFSMLETKKRKELLKEFTQSLNTIDLEKISL